VKAVNLIPADERAGVGGAAGRSGGVVWVLVGGLAGLTVMAGVYGLSVRHVADARVKDAAAMGQVAGARSRAAQLAPYQQFFTAGHGRITQVATLVKGRYDWSGVMHGIAVTLPSDVSLTTLTASLSPTGSPASPGAPASAPAAPTPPASTPAAPGTTPAAAAQVSPTVLLGGCARSHPEVAHILDALGAMSGVQNVSFASSTKGAASQTAGAGAGGCPPSSPAVFQVTITLHPTGATGASVSPAVAAQSAASPAVAAANAPAVPSPRRPAPVAPVVPGASGAPR